MGSSFKTTGSPSSGDVMPRARSTFVMLALSLGCHGDVESLDHAMSELIASVPTTIEIAAADTTICPSTSSCFDSANDHKLELALRPTKPAKRNPGTDFMHFTGSFRLLRLHDDRAEVLGEGELTEGVLSRSVHNYVFASMGFEGGHLWLDVLDGGDWGAPSLRLERLD